MSPGERPRQWSHGSYLHFQHTHSLWLYLSLSGTNLWTLQDTHNPSFAQCIVSLPLQSSLISSLANQEWVSVPDTHVYGCIKTQNQRYRVTPSSPLPPLFLVPDSQEREKPGWWDTVVPFKYDSYPLNSPSLTSTKRWQNTLGRTKPLKSRTMSWF